MSIFTYLYAEQSGDFCEYNGDLKEYLLRLDPSYKDYDLLRWLAESHDGIRVCINYRLPIVESSVSNMIIRYKDISKLDNKTIICPYIFYMKGQERSRAIIMDKDYLVAKGFYYVATERDGLLNEYKNYIIACDEDKDHLTEVFGKLYTERAARVQHDLDNEIFPTYDDLLSHAQEYADKRRDEIFGELMEAEDKAKLIQRVITEWFLLKKTAYVHYMVNKDILASRHDGDNRAQRAQAKKNADTIRFISLTELWKGRLDEH